MPIYLQLRSTDIIKCQEFDLQIISRWSKQKTHIRSDIIASFHDFQPHPKAITIISIDSRTSQKRILAIFPNSQLLLSQIYSQYFSQSYLGQ